MVISRTFTPEFDLLVSAAFVLLKFFSLSANAVGQAGGLGAFLLLFCFFFGFVFKFDLHYLFYAQNPPKQNTEILFVAFAAILSLMNSKRPFTQNV